LARKTAGEVQRIYSDSLGSAVAMTGPPDVTPIVSSQRYYPYGATRGPDAVDTPYQYTGQRHEADLGLYYYRARWYDPSLGRFIQPDTIVPEPGNPQAHNRYTYVYNNPFRYADPSGNNPEAIAGFALGMVKQWGYNNLCWFPVSRQTLRVQEHESGAEIAGRIVGNLVSAVQAGHQVPAGMGIAVKGGLLGLISGPPTGGATAVTLSPAAIGAGAAIAYHGLSVGISASTEMATLTHMMYSKSRGRGPSLSYKEPSHKVTGAHTKGTDVALRTGEPGSAYTRFKDGTPQKTTIYDHNGDAVIQIEWRGHQGVRGPHWHEFPPGRPDLGHGASAPHYAFESLEKFGLPPDALVFP
jgi:RHS repeat-associated protein